MFFDFLSNWWPTLLTVYLIAVCVIPYMTYQVSGAPAAGKVYRRLGFPIVMVTGLFRGTIVDRIQVMAHIRNRRHEFRRTFYHFPESPFMSQDLIDLALQKRAEAVQDAYNRWQSSIDEERDIYRRALVFSEVSFLDAVQMAQNYHYEVSFLWTDYVESQPGLPMLRAV